MMVILQIIIVNYDQNEKKEPLWFDPNNYITKDKISTVLLRILKRRGLQLKDRGKNYFFKTSGSWRKPNEIDTSPQLKDLGSFFKEAEYVVSFLSWK